MRKIVFSKFWYLFVVFVLSFPVFLSADSLDIDNNYRVRGLSYQNNHFDNSINDSMSFYSQRLNISLKGNFAPNIEIGTKISALGVAGSTRSAFSLLRSTFPYPNTDFTPFIENVYIKITSFVDLPVDVTIGKQSFEFGDGLIIGDNGIGYFGFRVSGKCARPFPFQYDVFTAKINDTVKPSADRDLNGLVGSLSWRKHLIELGFFQDTDNSGTLYNGNPTSSIAKNFYDIRVGHQEKYMNYQFEYAMQSGSVSELNGTNVTFNGFGYVAKGALIGNRTKIGKVTANALLAINSGNSGTASGTDGQFTPDLSKRFDGLERVGYGKLFAASTYDSFFPIPNTYSGIDTLNVGTDFSPWYGWNFGVGYFLYSASQGPNGAPNSSGFERIFGAEFTLGIELDLSAKYEFSKYLQSEFSYSRYTPPNFSIYWPKRDPATYYKLEIAAKF